MAESGDLQSREHPIPGQAMGRRQDVARLLSTQRSTAGHHRRMHMLIAHGRSLQHPTTGLPGPFEAKV